MELQKPLKYFEVYTQQIEEEAKAGISKSSSKLHLVPKGAAKHSSRQSSRLRGKDRAHTKDKTTLSQDASPLGDSKLSLPSSSSSSSKTPLTAETLAQHTAMLPANEATLPPVANMQEPVRVPLPAAIAVAQTPSYGSRYAKGGPPLPARLAVPLPLDIFAGPSSPVSADSLTNLAVSETQMELHLSNLPSSDTFSLPPQNVSHSRGPIARSASDPAHHDSLPFDRLQCTTRFNSEASIPESVSICETTARCFQLADSLPFSSKYQEISAIPSIDDIIRQHHVPAVPQRGATPSLSSPPVPSIPARFRAEKQKILSIEEIIQRNAKVQTSYRQLGQSAAPVLSSASRPTRSRTVTEDSDISQARSSIDSVTGEILQSIKHQAESQPLRVLQHARSQPSLSTPPPTRCRERQTSVFSDSQPDSSSHCSPLPRSESKIDRGTPVSDEDITRYIRSKRLTRLMTLRRPPNHHLVVSMADVGCEYGHPIVVFLGLGSVRYLVALYDELAESLGLRLICIDRWGLGKTGEVPDSRRGFREWATVVEEVLDQLGVSRFSILAHSAGAPYGLASSLRLADRVHGSIQLLAPWVGSASESTANAYKWLKFVPSGVIKTAQAAEWKVQGWRLGKLPKIQAQAVGFDPRAPLSSESTASSPIFAEYSMRLTTEDQEDHLSGRARSPSLLSESDHDGDFSPGETARTAATFLVTPAQTRIRKTSLDTSTDSSSPPCVETPSRLVRKVSTSTRATSTAPPSIRSHRTNPRVPAKLDLGTALMRASHAESLKGGTSDLLTILQKNSKGANFAYAEIARPVKVWHGLKDDKISLQSVMALETLIPNCTVHAIPGADHSLMTNVAVFVQVLRCIANEWDAESRL